MDKHPSGASAPGEADSAGISEERHVVDMSRGRLLSVDGYRGFVMFLLLASGIGLAMADSFPGSTFWNTVAYQQTHVAWVGCSLHDLIQPGFCFLVGTALTLSIARRLAQGQDARERAMHAFNRALLLVLLGLFIFSLHSMPLIFVDTLAQIGLAYLPAYILAGRSNRILWIAFSVILVVSWMAFVIYPVPDASFDYSKVGVSPDWLSAHGLDGFQAHWQKNSNVAWAFDTWFLNRFPRGWRFESMGSGDTTLNFVPLIATILLGVVAGRILQSEQRPWEKARSLAIGGIIGLMAGWSLNALGICPLVKAIWTPSWVLFSGGWCFLTLAVFHILGDILRCRRLLFPLTVLGTNSLGVYCLANLEGTLGRNLVGRFAAAATSFVAGPAFAPLLAGIAKLALFWLFFLLLYRFRIFWRV